MASRLAVSGALQMLGNSSEPGFFCRRASQHIPVPLQMLRNDLDLDQLDAQLSSGTVELRNLLLDCEYLNEQLVS